MIKKIILLSLCCSCLLNAGWYEDAQEKASKAYDSSKEYTKSNYNKAKKSVSDYNKEKDALKQQKLDTCINDLQEALPQYGLFLEQHYMEVNKRNEDKVLLTYKNLNKKGFSPELQSVMDESFIQKISSATSTLEYTSLLLSELKKIEKELKKNDSENKAQLIKQTEFLMYAWTTPMEILSSKKIYNSSLLGLSSKLYKNLNKSNYDNYTEFIYSMIYINLINENIVVRKSSTAEALGNTALTASHFGLGGLALASTEDKKGLQKVCEEVLSSYSDKSAKNYLSENIASTLRFQKEYTEKAIDSISKENNLFETAKIFNKKDISQLNEISIVENPLNDSWYLMIREYMELQDKFYLMKKEIDKIIKILTILPNNEKAVATLTQNLFDVDALYRKFDESVRYNIIDLPVSIYADLYSLEFRKGKKWYDDDEKVLSDIAVAYNKACANMQKYMASEFAVNKVMNITRTIKKEFNEDEYKEVITRAKLTQDWFNMLNKVKIKNN